MLHCHDWQTGSLVANTKILRPQNFKIVFSIHNIQYQGLFYRSDYDNLINLDREHFAGFEWDNNMNLMKAALYHADVITTVSETYAEELLTPFYGEGLEDLLYMRREKLYGVTNGLDLRDYDPNRDKAIFKRYKSSRKSKLKNKLWMQEQHGLKISEDIPMYGLVTRLVGQKGIDLIERVFREFLNQNHVQFVMVGSGEARYEDYFRQLERDFPDRVRVTIGFEEEYARQIYAASDFFIMPSLFEPCGLGQLISLRYLTMPIVRETGGLRDTVTPFNEHDLTGNGFSFAQYNAYDFLHTLNYSYEVYQNPEHVKALFANMKQSELGWDVSAEKYIAIYNQG